MSKNKIRIFVKPSNYSFSLLEPSSKSLHWQLQCILQPWSATLCSIHFY